MAARNPMPGSSPFMHGYQIPGRYMQGHQGIMVRGEPKGGYNAAFSRDRISFDNYLCLGLQHEVLSTRSA